MTKKDEILALLKEHPGLTYSEIRRLTGCGTAIISSLAREGKIRHSTGTAKYRYFVTTPINLPELARLMDAPVFAAVKRRQEASCKV